MSEAMDAIIESFVKTRLTDISGPDFERFDAATRLLDPKASATDPACSLLGLRDTLTGLRAAALARIDPSIGDFPDVESFRDLLKSRAEQMAADAEACKAAIQERARTEKIDRDFREMHVSKEWEKAYLLDMCDERVTRRGGKPLLGNYDYYESPTALKGIVRYMLGDHNFRSMRAEMNYLGHKRGSKALYDHLAAYRKARTDATAACEAASVAARDAQARSLESAARFRDMERWSSGDLLSDRDIVARLQTRVLTYCKQPDFIGHLAHVFGDAWPATIHATTPGGAFDEAALPSRPGTPEAPPAPLTA